jgi:hypothetical protein
VLLERFVRMSTLQASRLSPVADTPVSANRKWWRSFILCVLLLLSVALYILLTGAAPKRDDLIAPFLQVWMICFLPYLAACAFVLATKPAGGRWRRIEIGIILLGALIFRAMLLPLPPGLSHDSWRYLWDARVLLHGYSPYVYAPWDKVLEPLRDTVLYANSRFRSAPTIYPPGAELVYVLSYLLAPGNLYVLKGIFVGFDMVTCGALMLLLERKGLDARRAIIYAWCPLPVVEFAIQGHVDVITLTFTILVILSAANTSTRGRVLTGILIGLATLTKIYPILLLVVIIRRRDYALLAACFITIVLGYLPFLILGHGQAFGYFTIYASEQGQNAGVAQLVIHWLGDRGHFPLATTITLEHVVDLVLVSAVSLVVLILRQRERISMEAAILVLFGIILSISSHVFPWYTTTLLLWVPLLPGGTFAVRIGVGKPLEPVGAGVVVEGGGDACVAHDGGYDSRNKMTPATGDYGVRRAFWMSLRGTNLVSLAIWYFTCASLLGYYFNAAPDWTVYYRLVYDPVMIALGVAAIIGIVRRFTFQKGTRLAKR